MTATIIYFGSQLGFNQEDMGVVFITTVIITGVGVLVGLFIDKWLKLEMPYGIAVACGAAGFGIGCGVGIMVVLLGV